MVILKVCMEVHIWAIWTKWLRPVEHINQVNGVASAAFSPFHNMGELKWNGILKYYSNRSCFRLEWQSMNEEFPTTSIEASVDSIIRSAGSSCLLDQEDCPNARQLYSRPCCCRCHLPQQMEQETGEKELIEFESWLDDKIFYSKAKTHKKSKEWDEVLFVTQTRSLSSFFALFKLSR